MICLPITFQLAVLYYHGKSSHSYRLLFCYVKKKKTKDRIVIYDFSFVNVRIIEKENFRRNFRKDILFEMFSIIFLHVDLDQSI